MPNLFRVLQGGNGGSNSGGRSNNPNQAPAAARSRYTYPGQRGSLYASASDQTPEMIDPSEQNRSAPPQAMPSRMFDANPQTGRSHGSTPMMPREPPRTGSFANQNNPAIKTSSSDRVGLVPDLPIAAIQRSTTTASSGGSAKEIIVTVPPDVHPGSKFMVDVNGQWLVVTCPPTAGPNKKVKFAPPFKQDEPEAAPMRAQPPQGGPPDRMPVTVDSNTRPGAYQVTRTSSSPPQAYRVTVPAGVRPGDEFTVHAGPRRLRVRCPPTSRPGQSLKITLPPEPITHHVGLKMAPLTDPVGTGGGGAVPMSSEVQKVNQQAAESGGTARTFLVTIPPNVFPGMQFTVNVNGQRFMVTCPPTAGPNQKVRIVPPVKQDEPEAAPKTQVFEVAVPAGVQPGQPFALVANGQRVLVTCPPNVEPGQKIRFQLPVSQVVGNIELDYESNKSGWKRTVRVTDLKFQWVRLEEDKEESTAAVNVNVMEHFDVEPSFLEGNDARMRTGKLELVPANEACVDSRLVVHNHTLLSYADIASVQSKSLEKKQDWFQKICTQLTSVLEDGHVKIVVRRKHLLLDSVDSVMSLGREDMRKRWRIDFPGEPAIDAGGLAKQDWFQKICAQFTSEWEDDSEVRRKHFLLNSEVQKVNQQALELGGTAQTFLVAVPPNVYPGMQFTVNVNGQRFMMTCPQTAGPNQKVRVVAPFEQDEYEAIPKTQVFEATASLDAQARPVQGQSVAAASHTQSPVFPSRDEPETIPREPAILVSLGTTEKWLDELKIKLPPAPRNDVSYRLCHSLGTTLYLSGHLPFQEDGSLLSGKIGPKNRTAHEGYKASRQVGLNLMATLKKEIGDLDRVEKIVKVFGIVQSTDHFRGQNDVVNGCSDLLKEVFGDRGAHARTVIGTNTLPMDASVQIEAIVQIYAGS